MIRSIHQEPDPAERMRSADRIYDALRALLEPAHKGEIVAIDVETGDYYLGRTPLEACDKGRAKHPDSILACKRVGYPTALVVGGPVLT